MAGNSRRANTKRLNPERQAMMTTDPLERIQRELEGCADSLEQIAKPRAPFLKLVTGDSQTQIRRYDAYHSTNTDCGDLVVDFDDDCITSGIPPFEMQSRPSVRVLVGEGISTEDVRRLLNKVSKWIAATDDEDGDELPFSA